MNRCRECNSEITNVGAFCPFCGVMLNHERDEETGKGEAGKYSASSDIPSDDKKVSSLCSQDSKFNERNPDLFGSKIEDYEDYKKKGFPLDSKALIGLPSKLKKGEKQKVSRFEIKEEEKASESLSGAEAERKIGSGEITEEKPEVERKIEEKFAFSDTILSAMPNFSEKEKCDIEQTHRATVKLSEKVDGKENILGDNGKTPRKVPSETENRIEASTKHGDNSKEAALDKINEEIETTTIGKQATEFSSGNCAEETDTEHDTVANRSFEHPRTKANIRIRSTGVSSKTKLRPLDKGTVLNSRYEIVRKIGGGGMGTVYLAKDKNLGSVPRAIKEMVQLYMDEKKQEKAAKDFKRESILLTSLDHPSIPTIYDYFFDEKESRFYLVMKYISGSDLSGKLSSVPEGRLDEKSVVEWSIQVADVLNYLHSHEPPIVYRDVKPSNIMIDGNSGRAMLIDFGIARRINKEEKGVTSVGTMGYAPPELFSGKVESRSDIYSLGSTMFHLLTGVDPQSNPLLVFDFQNQKRPRQINPHLSDQIEQILMRCVEYSAERRFATAAEMRDTLKQHLDSLQKGSVSYSVKQVKKSPKAIGLSNQPVFCGFCGQKIVAADVFCAFCGAKQPSVQPSVQFRRRISAHVTAKLIVDGTSELDVPVFSLDKDDNLVGRCDPMTNIFPEIDLSKFDPQTKISRRHARIWRDADNFMIEDLASSNGTILMPTFSDMFKLAPNKSHVLTTGDKIKLGDTTLHFVVE